MFRLIAPTTLLTFATLMAGCTFPPGNLHNPNYVKPTQIADDYAEYTDISRKTYRVSNPCIAAFIIAAAHPSADSLGNKTSRKMTALEDLKRGINSSTGSVEDERICAVKTADIFSGGTIYPGGSLFKPSPDILTCLRTSYDAPRIVTVTELDTCLAAN